MTIRMLIAGSMLAAFPTVASAHVTDDPDAPPHYAGYDCSAMSGTFDAAGTEVRIDVADADVVFTAIGKTAVVGQCVAPLIESGTIYPQATIALTADFGIAPAEGCCVATLKEGSISFDKTAVTWTRK